LEDAVKFDPYNRTVSDETVSFLINISVLMEPIRKPKPPKEPLIKSYINNYGQENSSGLQAQTM
jgi:hypothetical protein